MTQHSSLKGGQGDSKFRSVLKRYERIKELDEKEKWDEEKDSIYHLPKIKRIKFKVKKVKTEEEEAAGKEAVPVEGAAAGAVQAGAPAKEKTAVPAGKEKAAGETAKAGKPEKKAKA